MVFRELNNSLYFWSFFLQPQIFATILEDDFHSFFHHLQILNLINCCFKIMRWCQIYPRCHPIPMIFVASRENVLVQVSTSIRRIADTVVQHYMQRRAALGAAALAPGVWSAAPSPLLLNKNPYICSKN